MAKESVKAPSALAIEVHYKRLDLQDKWNERRIKRLCGFLPLTEQELGTSWNKRGYFFQTTSKKGDIYASMYPFNNFGKSSHWGFRK